MKKNGFRTFLLWLTIILIGTSANSFAQSKKKTRKGRPANVPIMRAPDEFNLNCSPINEDAVITVFDDGNLGLGSSKVEKTNLTNELTNYLCGKIPPEQIIHMQANPNVSFSHIIEAIKLGRKTKTDDFGLRIINDTASESLIKVVEEQKNLSSKKVKANPLALMISISAIGIIKLNNKIETIDALKERLTKTFLARKQKRIYAMGSNDVEKAVFIYSDGNAKFADVLNLIKEIEKSGAYPIGLDVDEFYLKTIF